MTTALAALVVLALISVGAVARAEEYTGPIIDAHSHLSGPRVIDEYVEAMRQNNVIRVILLGLGGAQKQDPLWIGAAARKYPRSVVPAVPLLNPDAPDAATQLDADITRTKARIVGEVDIRHVARKIDRDPSSDAFGRILEVATRQLTPLVIHDDLNDAAAARLEKALAGYRRATIILAHAGGATPARLDGLLQRNPNLLIDLSGMDFSRKPALATETGPMDPAFKALIEKMPDRFLIGIDVWSAKSYQPEMLDRMMKWTRRVLGELKPEAAERVAAKNASGLLHLD
jgi:Tat protein secretion system quality control protein TatD with DNase activity